MTFATFFDNWEATPSVQGRCATEEDVVAKRAVFHIPQAEEAGVQFTDVSLPVCAIHFDEEGNPLRPVIVIQMEIVPQEDDEPAIICGIKTPGNDFSACLMEELELISSPEETQKYFS